ncbi:MAG: dipeptidase, partial [Bacteroidota bacterium]|nr:dipeptidase [Bacteroidota bacterium]
GCNHGGRARSDEELMRLAQKICERNIILDSHIDWPDWLLYNHQDISEKTTNGDFDLVRAKEGGLNAVLSVVYIDPKYGVDSGRIMVDSMLNIIHYYPHKYPDKFAMAFTPGDVRKNFDRNLFSLIPCLENGSPAGNDLAYLEYLKKQGIAYVTLCHSKRNQISDSSFDPDRTWKGLSPEGREFIKKMNQLGIMIDVSHTTDSTVAQALRLSDAPIIASHSSCRYFVPGFERNLPDGLIKGIAKKGGVVMVNFAAMFLDSTCMKNTNILRDSLNSLGLSYDSPEGTVFIEKFGRARQLFPDSKRLVDHIEHIIHIAGIDYVGLGSDFDGIGPSKPSGVTDVSDYPVIVAELLRRGYSEKDIARILSGNFLRVWDEVQKAAGHLGPGGQ